MEHAAALARVLRQLRAKHSWVLAQAPRTVPDSPVVAACRHLRVVAHSLGCRHLLEAVKLLALEERPDEVHLCAPACTQVRRCCGSAALARVTSTAGHCGHCVARSSPQGCAVSLPIGPDPGRHIPAAGRKPCAGCDRRAAPACRALGIGGSSGPSPARWRSGVACWQPAVHRCATRALADQGGVAPARYPKRYA